MKIVRKANPGSGVLAREVVVFDDLGRVFEEKRLLPDGGLPGDSLNLRQTLYNGRGWKESVSEVVAEVETPAHVTVFQGYDPFGRPTAIVPPDGPAHSVTLAHTGVSQVSRTVRIAGSDGEFPSTTTEIYDRQGRLHQVLEPIGLEGQTTTYEYDAGNRLKKVSASDGVTTQVREFVYDGRGFLVSETHPEMEMGPSGSGSVVYEDYDARGHAGKKTDAERYLAFTYDRAERLTGVQENDDQGNLKAVLKQFVYGTAGRANGKLVTAIRHNYIPEDIPDFGGNDFEVVERYFYDGTGGRISERRIQRSGADQFTQGFEWTDLGSLAKLTYPSCVAGAPCGSMGAPVREVTYDYDAGFLTSIPGYAPAIGYHANEMLASVAHANGVTEVWTADPDGMRRPARIETQGVTTEPGGGNFDTGDYAYDGAGNITAMGADAFAYDGVSRLASATVDIRGFTYSQTQSYDPFGNRIGDVTDPVTDPVAGATHRSFATDPGTNRLLGSPEVPVSYDGAGNLTSRGQTTYSYDGLQMLQRLESPEASPGPVDHVYVYTADDERIVVIDFDAPLLTNLWYLRDHNGQLLRQLKEEKPEVGPNLWSWSRDTIRRDGQLLATETPGEGNQLQHHHLDHLGTPRLLTDAAAYPVVWHDLLPFGEEPPAPIVPEDPQPFRFTGHERDDNGTAPALCGDPPVPCQDLVTVDGVLSRTKRRAAAVRLDAGPDVTIASGADVTLRAGEVVAISGEFAMEAGAELAIENEAVLGGVGVGLDYMHARYCSPGLGRFLSVDPAGESADPRKPQSWNRYSYVQNRPLSFIDPTGEILFFFSSSTADLEELEQLANEDLFGVDLVIGHTGEASLVANDEFGPPTPEQAAFADVLQTAIDSTSNIGLNVTRNSSQALVGNRVGEIDIADMAMLQGTITGFAGALAHEVAEQSFLQTIDPRLTEGQVLARTSPTRPEHLAGIAAQSAVAGAQRIRTTRTGQLRVTDFAGGKTVRFIVRNGNIIKVIK